MEGVLPWDSDQPYNMSVGLLLLLQCFYLSLFVLLMGRASAQEFGGDSPDGTIFMILCLLPSLLSLFVVAPPTLKTLIFLLAVCQTNFEIKEEVEEFQELMIADFRAQVKAKIQEMERALVGGKKSASRMESLRSDMEKGKLTNAGYETGVAQAFAFLDGDEKDVEEEKAWPEIKERLLAGEKFKLPPRAAAMLLFFELDDDNSGSIDGRELKGAMHEQGIEMRDGQDAVLLRCVDESGDGEIDFDEFCEVALFEEDDE